MSHSEQSLSEQSLALHKTYRGKIGTEVKIPLKTKEDISVAYTPGVGAVCTAIAENASYANVYTNIGNTVAIITDGSAVLGLGNIGPLAAMPVMEGKAALFKTYAAIDAVPLVLGTQDPQAIIATVQAIAPSFAGINLEDIAAPHCFEIEKALRASLSIPVFHDDQHGTAIVVLAGLITALRLRGGIPEHATIVINGAGAAGIAIFELLWACGYHSCCVVDSKGVLHPSRTDLSSEKKAIALQTQPKVHTLEEALVGADVCIGVSKAGLITATHIASMASKPIVFALANPVPEIMPDEAYAAGAYIVATGRSDMPNQINNALVFPGLFRGMIDAKKSAITFSLMGDIAKAIASLVETPTPEYIIPDITDMRIVPTIREVCMK